MTMSAPLTGLELFNVDLHPQAEDDPTKSHPIIDTTDEIPAVLSLNEFLEPNQRQIETNHQDLGIIDYSFTDLQLQSPSPDQASETILINHQLDNQDPQGSNSNSSSVFMVEYDPQLKTKRLGRPRKHLEASQPVHPESNSVDNLNALVLLRFRLDSRPVVGPGSRGGRIGGRSSRSATQRRKKEKQNEEEYKELDGKVEAFGNGGERHNLIDSEQSPDNLKTENGIKNDIPESSAYEEEEDLGETAISIMKQTNKEKLEVFSKAKEESESKKPSFSNQNFAARTLRTTIVGTKSRNVRILPGPLMALTYHLYDDNFINRDLAKDQKIAYGYPVKIAPFAEDISIIILYLSRFSHIIWPDPRRALKLGPQDFEKGLGLPIYPQSPTEEQYVNYARVDPDESYNPSYVSKDMNNLFCRLLTLTLNKKREIQPSQQKNSLNELKALIPQLGYPKEWRDDSSVVDPIIKNETNVSEAPVDPNQPEILYYDKQVFNPPIYIYNPYQEPDFERYGLAALTPINRLIMLRLLCQWSTVTSDSLKSFIFENSEYQDIGGEKTTLYVSRAILKGFKNAEDALVEAEAKINKKIANAVKNKEKERCENEKEGKKSEKIEKRVNNKKVGDLKNGVLHVKKTLEDQKLISKSPPKLKSKSKKSKDIASQEFEDSTPSTDKESSPVDNKAILAELALQDADLVRYVDPTSNPLDHPMRWRLDELFVGDGGLHIGRFYLSRMACGAPGGLDCVKKMRSAFSSSRDFRDSPSSFKLYVEDVHQILLNEFTKFGVEFDETGKEIQNRPTEEEWGCTWYEVASNAEEIQQFVEYLNFKLDTFTSGAIKQAIVLRDYLADILPLLKQQETIELYDKTERSGRKREIDYSEEGQSKLRRVEDSPIDYFEDDEDDIIRTIENDDDDEDYRE